MDLNALSARELSARIRRGELSATSVIRDTLDRVAKVNPQINAIVQDCGADALAEADALDRRIAAGQQVGALAGVPVTVKVVSDQKGYATTNGTRIFKDVIAPQDNPFLRHMREKDAIVIGRTNTPAFSYRWFTTNQMHGETKNPHNPALTAGGSSGGAAAAAAAGLGHIAHGSDIAGSIRYPAYACGIQGLRPTPGRIPQFNHSGPDRGIGPQIMAVSGPIARRVDDLRLGLEGMAGYAPDDPWTAPVPLTGPAYRRRVALVKRPGGIATDPRILDDLDRAAAMFRAAGWGVEEPTEIPEIREAVDLQIDLWLSDGHADKMALAEQEGDPGALALLTHYADRAAAIDVKRFGEIFARRSALIRAWRGFLQDYPVVLMPVSAELPFRQDEDLEGSAVLARLWESQLPQIAIPLLALPGISIASGVVDGMPSGVQLVAPPWREDICLEAGELLERGFGFPALAL
ncbi:amidase family protein [Salipiger sp. P9]|uniref:amidase family protein n=1 Tax=Salipiger pentaromativorans TaxID=2943193 RepID=UPI00215895FD|nr:amidase family protein [Salipiger pentaromativorans]MCR8546358.1 amidase family protein [Salipiger pentaromativorans]